MFLIATIIEWMRDFLNSSFGILVSFVSLIAWLFGTIAFATKFVKKNLNTVKGISLISLILLVGLFFPTLILLTSTWSNFIHIILNVLAILGLINFFLLLYLMKQMSFALVKPESGINIEEQSIGLRTTYEFFNGDINIYLIGERFFGSPVDHKITARIWSPDYTEVIIKDKAVGFSMIYKSKIKYLIRITKAATNVATFSVTRT